MPDIELTRPDGGKIRGYIAEPQTPIKGAVVVIQEWWGLNNQIRGIADKLAAEGFLALAPDLYKGKVAADAAEANHEMSHLDWGQAVSQDLAAAVNHLKASGKKIASLGFCMGGALTILSALNHPISAAVCFYGIPPAEAADPSQIKIPFLGHFATQDDWCNAKAVGALEEKLKAGSVPHTLHNYEAEHAFMNEQRPEVYDAAAAKLAWERSIAFLEENLQ